MNMVICPNQINAGILLVGKTYGRSKNGSGKFYYKCIPHDKQLTPLLIPYEFKTVGFNKHIHNHE